MAGQRPVSIITVRDKFLRDTLRFCDGSFPFGKPEGGLREITLFNEKVESIQHPVG